MSKIAHVIIALGNFSIGLLLPLMNLILLDKGASLQTLPLLLAVYSSTVLVFELPSGIMADLLGRKVIYLISSVLKLLSLTLLLLTFHPIWLIFVMFLNGLSRAFSSGSLDALFIDQAIAKCGEGILSKVTSALSVLEGIGLALGTVAGGFLATICGSYSAVITVCLLLNILLFTLNLLFVKEVRESNKTKRELPSFSRIKLELRSLSSPKRFSYILAGLFLTGFFLCSVETYWQPAFQSMSNSTNQSWLYGMISFFSFASITLGNLLIGKLLFRFQNKWWELFSLTRILFAILILVFALQNSKLGFILLYTLVYFSLGTSNVAESSIMNKLIPTNLRSSFLSLGSLVVQIGALFASILSSILINYLHITGLWLLSGTLIFLYAVASIYISISQSQKQSINTLDTTE